MIGEYRAARELREGLGCGTYIGKAEYCDTCANGSFSRSRWPARASREAGSSDGEAAGLRGGENIEDLEPTAVDALAAAWEGQRRRDLKSRPAAPGLVEDAEAESVFAVLDKEESSRVGTCAWCDRPASAGPYSLAEPVDFQATILLCDAAQSVNNKLYILGGGWSIIGPDPVSSALALYIKVPWDAANEKHTLRLELLDSDGDPVNADTQIGKQPIVLDNEFEVGRPPGLAKGTPIDLALAINIGPLPLAAGGRFEWRLSINGRSRDHWRAAFSTRSGPAPGGSVGSEGFGA